MLTITIPMGPDREHAELALPDKFDADDLQFVVKVIGLYCPRLTGQELPCRKSDEDLIVAMAEHIHTLSKQSPIVLLEAAATDLPAVPPCTTRLAEVGPEEDPFGGLHGVAEAEPKNGAFYEKEDGKLTGYVRIYEKGEVVRELSGVAPEDAGEAMRHINRVHAEAKAAEGDTGPLGEFVTGVKKLCEAAVENEFEGYWKCPHCPRTFQTEMGLKVHKGTRHKDKSAVDRKIDETQYKRVFAPLKASAMFQPTEEPFTMDWILVCRVLYMRAEDKGLADIALALSDDYTKWQPEQVAKVVEVYDDSVAALRDARAKSLEDYNKKKVDVQAFVQRDAKDGKVSFGP